MWLRVVTIFKKDSADEVHQVGYRRLPNGEFQLVDKRGFRDEYDVPVLKQTFNTEKEANAAFERRIEELALQGFVIKLRGVGPPDTGYSVSISTPIWMSLNGVSTIARTQFYQAAQRRRLPAAFIHWLK
jgi:hypothetical protein